MLYPFAPSISAIIQMAMGPFYLVWFPMLAWDFFHLGKRAGLLAEFKFAQ
jgi:hypothetical protein